MGPRKLYTSLTILLVFIFIFFLKEKFNGELYQDEFHYLPTAVFFSKEPVPSLTLLQGYNELNTPIPFILGGWVINVFGENIQNLRLLTFFVSLSLLMIFVWAAPASSPRFFLCLIGLMAFPNYYLCSVFYYTDIFAMISVLAGMVAYLRRLHWAGLLFFIVAISCRQYMLAFPAGIVIYELWLIFRNGVSFKLLHENLLAEKTWIFYALAVLGIIPWVMIWDGPAPAAVMADQHYDSDKLINYNFGYVIYSSVCIAVYYVIWEVLITGKIKYFMKYPKQNPKLFVANLLVVILLISFFPAKQAYNPYFTWPYLGYIDQGLMTIGITGIVKQLCFGFLMMITLMRFVSPNFNLASCLVFVNILLLGKAQLSWDKYSLPLIMVLWFLALFDDQWSLSESARQNEFETLNVRQ